MIFSIIYGVFVVILGIVMDFSDIFYVNDDHTLNKGGVVSAIPFIFRDENNVVNFLFFQGVQHLLEHRR